MDIFCLNRKLSIPSADQSIIHQTIIHLSMRLSNYVASNHKCINPSHNQFHHKMYPLNSIQSTIKSQSMNSLIYHIINFFTSQWIHTYTNPSVHLYKLNHQFIHPLTHNFIHPITHQFTILLPISSSLSTKPSVHLYPLIHQVIHP